jgi:uncharacterized protein YjiS (DUF1127 family)
MHQEHSSERLLIPAGLYIAFDDEETTAAVAGDRDTARKGSSRTALHLAYVNPDATTMTPEKDPEHRTVWSKILNFVIEGLTISGASLHPMDEFLRDDRWPDAKNKPQEIMSPDGQRVTVMFPVPSPAVAPGWNWWASSREVAAAIAAHLRKERDIKRAVDALSELDDKTLQDIGIPHRSRIEYVVRYCHDC